MCLCIYPGLQCTCMECSVYVHSVFEYTDMVYLDIMTLCAGPKL